MAEYPSVPEPSRPPAPPRASNWTSSRGTETVVPWVVTIDLRPAAETHPGLPPQPRTTTPADEDWMTGCYYF